MRPIYGAQFRGEIRKRMSPASKDHLLKFQGLQVLAVKRFIAGGTYGNEKGS